MALKRNKKNCLPYRTEKKYKRISKGRKIM